MNGFKSFFCFKQKTAYEMSLRDWSSDVCSSDLGPAGLGTRSEAEDPGNGEPFISVNAPVVPSTVNPGMPLFPVSETYKKVPVASNASIKGATCKEEVLNGDPGA